MKVIAYFRMSISLIKTCDLTSLKLGPVALFPYPSHDGKYRIVTTLGDFVYDDSAEVTHGIGLEYY